MKVVSYLNSVPSISLGKNSQKELLLRYFIEGVNKHDNGIVYKGYDADQNADVGVIQGWVYDNVQTPHLKLRKNVITNYIEKNKHVVTADSNLFLFSDKTNPHGYLRYSFNGVFPNTGIYCDNDIDKSRWDKISKNTGIQLKDKKQNGSCILLCLQRNGGWSMDGLSIIDWILNTVKEIRKYSDRKIVLRAHPGDKRAKDYLTHRYNNLPNVTISQFGKSLEEDLKDTWAVVNHNSSSIVGPLIYGYPGFITDYKRSQCAEVCHHTFENIETPIKFDREQWLQRISMFHWNFNELKSGEAWSHMKGYIK